MPRPRSDREDRGPYRVRYIGPEKEWRGREGTLYRDEYNDGLFDVDMDDPLLPDENWSFDPDGSDVGVFCGLEDVELLDD